MRSGLADLFGLPRCFFGSEKVHLLSGRLTATPARTPDGAADDAEHGQIAEGGPGNEDALGVSIRVRWGDREAVRFHQKEIVRQDPFEHIAIAKIDADPKAVLFGPRGEDGFLFCFGIRFEFADKVNSLDVFIRDRNDLRRTIEQLDAGGPQESLRAHVTVKQGSVKAPNIDFLGCRGGQDDGPFGGGWRAPLFCRYANMLPNPMSSGSLMISY